MSRSRVLISLLTCVGLAGSGLSVAQEGGDKQLDRQLEDLLRANFRACQEENVAAVLNTLHPKSPVVPLTAESLTHLFETYDLAYELLSFKLIGRDGDCAVARASQRTTKVKGPEFKDNVIHSIYVFRQDNGSWKLWNQVLLDAQVEPGRAKVRVENRE